MSNNQFSVFILFCFCLFLYRRILNWKKYVRIQIRFQNSELWKFHIPTRKYRIWNQISKYNLNKVGVWVWNCPFRLLRSRSLGLVGKETHFTKNDVLTKKVKMKGNSGICINNRYRWISISFSDEFYWSRYMCLQI